MAAETSTTDIGTSMAPDVDEGFVETPSGVADFMAANLLFDSPSEDDTILFPGLGTGQLYDAVADHCRSRDQPMPNAIGVEKNSTRADYFKRTHPDAEIDVQETDFLLDPPEQNADYIIANPPYLNYNDVDHDTRTTYLASDYETANGRFNLFHLFFEQAIRCLAPGGELVFLTPLSYLESHNRTELRDLIRRHEAHGFFKLPAETFPDHTVETVMTVLRKPEHGAKTNASEFSRVWLEPLQVPDFNSIYADHPTVDESHWSDYKESFQSDRETVLHRNQGAEDRLEKNPLDYPAVHDPYSHTSDLETDAGVESKAGSSQVSFDDF